MEVRTLWWSEGLAVLISEQYKFDTDIIEYLKKDITKGELSKIKDLDGANAYTWGWSVINYIIDNFGINKINYIMQKTCDSDIFKYLKISESEFEKKWHEFALINTKQLIDGSK